MEQKDYKSKVPRWMRKICRQKSNMMPDENPYDVLPAAANFQSATSITDSGIDGTYKTSTIGNHGNQHPSGQSLTSDIREHAQRTAASSDVDANENHDDLNIEHVVLVHSGNESETVGNPHIGEVRIIVDRATAKGAPPVPPRVANQYQNASAEPKPEKRNKRNSETRNSGPALPPRPPALGDYITVCIPHSAIRRGYINKPLDISDQYLKFPSLEQGRIPSLREENEYAFLSETPCNAPPPESVSGETDANPRPPTGHKYKSGSNGYLSVNKYSPNYLKTRLTAIELPNNIKDFLSDLKQQREFGAVEIDENAVTIPLFNTSDDIISEDALVVSVPENSVDKTTQLMFAKSTNKADFPPNVHCKNICSDVIHMLPHGITFKEPVLIRIPLYATANEKQLTVMYSDSDSCTPNPVWHTLDNHRSSQNHHSNANGDHGNQAPVWFFQDSFLFLYVTHFCMFVVVDAQSGIEERYIPLRTIMRLEYKPRLKSIAATVTFKSQEKCPDSTMAKEEEEGVYEEAFMFCDNRQHACVTLEADPAWSFMGRQNKTQEVSHIQLANIDRLAVSPRVSFNLRCDHAQDDTSVFIYLTVSQRGGDIPTQIDSFFTLSEITRSTRPPIPGSCDASPSPNYAFPGNPTSNHPAQPLSNAESPIDPSDKLNGATAAPFNKAPQENDDPTAHSVSAAAVPYIAKTERWLPFDYDRSTRKGILIPDAYTQNELARLLDCSGTWNGIATALKMPVHCLEHTFSPSKQMIRTYALKGKYVNWDRFSDEVGRHSVEAAEVLKEWYSQQTIPKQTYTGRA